MPSKQLGDETWKLFESSRSSGLALLTPEFLLFLIDFVLGLASVLKTTFDGDGDFSCSTTVLFGTVAFPLLLACLLLLSLL